MTGPAAPRGPGAPPPPAAAAPPAPGDPPATTTAPTPGDPLAAAAPTPADPPATTTPPTPGDPPATTTPPVLDARRRAEAFADPLLHALVAAAVSAPLVPRGGRGPLLAAVAAGTLIDLDHPVAARSLRLEAMLSLDSRPRSHSALAAAATGAAAAAAGGPVYGWAAFAGLLSHVLRDAADDSAPTPVLWPWPAPPRLSGEALVAAAAALALGSWAVSLGAAARRGRAVSRRRPGG